MSDKEIKILAIESSCDETAAAVVVNGRDVRSNVIFITDLHFHTFIWRCRSGDCFAKTYLKKSIR